MDLARNRHPRPTDLAREELLGPADLAREELLGPADLAREEHPRTCFEEGSAAGGGMGRSPQILFEGEAGA